MKVKVLDLRPTQMALGMKEVDYRVAKIRRMKSRELEDYLHERKVPVVFGAQSRIYLIDHHHLARACWEAGVEEVPTEKKGDLSHLPLKELWEVMHQSRWVYPYDQLGGGPHEPIHLPENIKGLADDPFRSLAWMVREKGGFDKVEAPFCEFHWANFFRKHLKKHPIADEFEHAMKEALEIARSAIASHLPGHRAK